MDEISVYKVCKIKNGNYISVSLPEDSFAEVTYKVGEWVQPLPGMLELGYGLTTFKHLARAKEFAAHCQARSNKEIALFLAVGKSPMPLPKMVPGYYAMKIPMSLPSFINSNKIYMLWPSGTLMFEQVMLIEKI